MNKSESISNLAKALSLAQGAMGKAQMSSTNPHFKSKYADLESLWDACKYYLHTNGLSVVQLPSCESGQYYVETILLHSSGEWISGRCYIQPSKLDPHGIMSSYTYARRGGLQAMVGLCGDSDDDGNSAMNFSTPSRPATPAKPSTPMARTILPKPAATSTPSTGLEDLLDQDSIADSQGKSDPWSATEADDDLPF
jgi:hypothetical protein